MCGVERRQSTFEAHKQEVEHFLKDNISLSLKKKEKRNFTNFTTTRPLGSGDMFHKVIPELCSGK